MFDARGSGREGVHPEELDNESTIAYFSNIAHKFESGYRDNMEFIHKYKLMSALIERYSQAGESAVDYGCGTGIFTRKLSEFYDTVVGIDASHKMIEYCNQQVRNKKIKYICSPIPFNKNLDYIRADFSICFHLLEYIDDWQAALSDMIARLNSNGTMIVSCPNPDAVSRVYASMMTHTCGLAFKYFRFVRNSLRLQELMYFVTKDSQVDVVDSFYYGASRFKKLLEILNFPEHRIGSSFVVVLKKRPPQQNLWAIGGVGRLPSA